MKLVKSLSLIITMGALFISCKNKEKTEVKNEKEVVENTIPADAKLETAKLTIEGMTCEIGCAKTIEDKLAHTKGVKEAEVDFENKLATVTFDTNQQNVNSLTETIEAVAGGDSYKVIDSKTSH